MMLKRFALTSALFFFFAANARAGTISFEVAGEIDLQISLSLAPAAEEWEQTSPGTFECNGYTLTFRESFDGGRSEVKVELIRARQAPFLLRNFQALWILNNPDLFAIWTYNQNPSTHRNYTALSSEPFGTYTSANLGIPYAAAVTRKGDNLLAVGALTQNRVMYLGGAPYEDGAYYLYLGTQVPMFQRTFEETLFIDVTPGNWFDITRGYADWVDQVRNYKPFPVSPACFYPMYDTWYWSLDNVNLDLHWKNLVLAKDLGFQSYLFDAGWESETGELARWLAGSLGNYSAPPGKLPNFDQFLQRAKRDLKMNVVLWMAPYAVGRASGNYPATQKSHSQFRTTRPGFKGGSADTPFTLPLDSGYEENVNLCPRYSETPIYLKSLMERVSRTYAPDGYWLDFQESIPFVCEARHKHSPSFGSAFNFSQLKITEAVLENVNQPTVEMRYPSANLNNKQYANLWQSTDSPDDFDAMRLCNLIMRPFSRGVVMGTDEMYWHPSSDAITVAKFAATVVFSGVPAFGANFQSAPRSHADIVKAWLKFYRDNQADLTGGVFEPFGDFVTPEQKIESEQKAFLYLRTGYTSDLSLDGTPHTVYISNCTDQDQVEITLQGAKSGAYQVQIYDGQLRLLTTKTRQFNELVSVSEAVPQGGLLKLARQ